MGSETESLAARLGKQHLEGESDPESDADSNDGDEAPDAKKRARTYDIVLENQTGLPLQVVQWPVRASKHSPFVLATHRGANFHDSVPPSGTIFSPSADGSDPHLVGSFRGPRKISLLHRWGWIYLDLITASRRRVHLQLYIHCTRHGVDKALIGRTDLDSTNENPMASGVLDSEGKRLEDGRVLFILSPALGSVQNTVDDSTHAARRLLAGKGVTTLSYVSTELGRASLLVGNEARYHEFEPLEGQGKLARFKSSTHEVEGIASKFVGAFVECDGRSWWEGSVTVDPLTGNAEGKGGLDVTARSTARFTEGICLNVGFHDAGKSRQDQLYVYVTPDHSSWLGDLISSDATWLKLPFSRLALPAAHDSGMFGPLDAGLAQLIQGGKLGNALTSALESEVATPFIRFVVDTLELVRLKPDRVINNMALTQKDSFADQLRIGVRFFDFRPGFCFHDVINLKKGTIHHQHAMVPGCTYLTFLTSILEFLVAHPHEIVMTELKSDGFVVHADKEHNGQVSIYSMVPTPEELQAVWDAAQAAVPNSGVKMGHAADLDRAIGELLQEGLRLIVVDKVHNPDAWNRNDSYDHVAYNTEDPATIIAALEKTFAVSSHSDPPSEETPARGCIYQLQATPTANIWDDVQASITYSDSSSLLTYVKPRQDAQTYPWLASHTFEEPGNVILLNDFVEGALVEHAIAISRQRAGLA